MYSDTQSLRGKLNAVALETAAGSGVARRPVRHLVQLGVQRAAELHVLDQVGSLALVRRDDADLARLGSGLQQPRGDLLHVGRLRPAAERRVGVRAS